MFKYLKFYITPLISPIIIAGLLLGGNYMWLGFLSLLIIFLLGDAIFPEDMDESRYKYPSIIEFPLFLALPVLIVLLIAFAWSSGIGDKDLFGINNILVNYINYDFIGIRNTNTWFHYLGGILTVGFSIAGIGTNIGHELTHRTKNTISMIFGRLMFSMSCNADFSIEHVYGHHVNVCTDKDPASAKRGENVYLFFIKSTILGHISAWKIELRRLNFKKKSIISLHNKILTGYLMSFIWISLFIYAGGSFGMFLFISQAIVAKFVLEVVNYFEHYGLRRKIGEKVGPQHSWNTNKRLSSMFLFSLTRHSAHHEKPTKQFWKLSSYKNAPELPFGYFTSLLICLVPPIWMKIMDPLLDQWEIDYEKNN